MPGVITPDMGLFLRGARLGHIRYYLGRGQNPNFSKTPHTSLFLVPTTSGEATPPYFFARTLHLPHFCSLFPHFHVQGLFAQFGKVPSFLPLSCRLEAWNWCRTLSVTWL